MTVERSVGYGVFITRDPKHEGWVTARLRKHFWSVDAGSRSRPVATTGFYTLGMTEADILESALRELLRALADEVG